MDSKFYQRVVINPHSAEDVEWHKKHARRHLASLEDRLVQLNRERDALLLEIEMVRRSLES